MGHVAPSIFAAAIALALLVRVRRLFGRQRLSVPRLVLRTTILSSLVAFLVLLPSAPLVIRELGVALGVALAVGGVLSTRFEREGATAYYRPNPVLGLVIVALLVGRLVQRLLVAKDLSLVMDGGARFGGGYGDPWSRLLVLAVLSYFAVYYVGILAVSRLGPFGRTAG